MKRLTNYSIILGSLAATFCGMPNVVYAGTITGGILHQSGMNIPIDVLQNKPQIISETKRLTGLDFSETEFTVENSGDVKQVFFNIEVHNDTINFPNGGGIGTGGIPFDCFEFRLRSESPGLIFTNNNIQPRPPEASLSKVSDSQDGKSIQFTGRPLSPGFSANFIISLFVPDNIPNNKFFIEQTPSVIVSSVPEPSSVFSVLVIGALGAGLLLKRKPKKQRSARVVMSKIYSGFLISEVQHLKERGSRGEPCVRPE